MNKKYTCANPECNILVCLECMESLITFSSEKSLLPTCPSNDCHGLYIISNFKGLNRNIIKTYELTCLDYFTKENGDTIKKQLEEKKIVERIRDERLKFIEQEFPKGITFVAKLAFKDKMNQLDKQKRAIVNLRLKDASKSCVYSTCNGFLDPDFVCMTCLTQFCKQCEKKLTKDANVNKKSLDSQFG